MRFKKIPITILSESNKDLLEIISKIKWTSIPNNLGDNDNCYIEEQFISNSKNLKSTLHKAFLYLNPKYRTINNFPHNLSHVSEEIKLKYD